MVTFWKYTIKDRLQDQAQELEQRMKDGSATRRTLHEYNALVFLTKLINQ